MQYIISWLEQIQVHWPLELNCAYNPFAMNEANRQLAIPIGLMLLASSCDTSLEKLDTFPAALSGVWTYDSGAAAIDLCETLYVSLKRRQVVIARECVGEARSIQKYDVREVSVGRAFLSDKIVAYHVSTEGPEVVVEPRSRKETARISMQLWVSDKYGPIKSLGVFRLKR